MLVIGAARSIDVSTEEGASMRAEQMRELTGGVRVTSAQQHVGRPGRRGEVVEAVTEPGHERCRIRWDDGGETFVYPGSPIIVEQPPGAGDTPIE